MHGSEATPGTCQCSGPLAAVNPGGGSAASRVMSDPCCAPFEETNVRNAFPQSRFCSGRLQGGTEGTTPGLARSISTLRMAPRGPSPPTPAPQGTALDLSAHAHPGVPGHWLLFPSGPLGYLATKPTCSQDSAWRGGAPFATLQHFSGSGSLQSGIPLWHNCRGHGGWKGEPGRSALASRGPTSQ